MNVTVERAGWWWRISVEIAGKVFTGIDCYWTRAAAEVDAEWLRKECDHDAGY